MQAWQNEPSGAPRSTRFSGDCGALSSQRHPPWPPLGNAGPLDFQEQPKERRALIAGKSRQCFEQKSWQSTSYPPHYAPGQPLPGSKEGEMRLALLISLGSSGHLFVRVMKAKQAFNPRNPRRSVLAKPPRRDPGQITEISRLAGGAALSKKNNGAVRLRKLAPCRTKGTAALRPGLVVVVTLV